MYASFVSQNTGFHVQQVVAFAFYMVRTVSFQLKFLRFEVITRVILVRDGDGYNVQRHEIRQQVIPFTSHAEHL